MSAKQEIELNKNIDVQIIAKCDVCGNELDIELSEHDAVAYRDRADILVTAKPCEECLGKAKDEGKAEAEKPVE